MIESSDIEVAGGPPNLLASPGASMRFFPDRSDFSQTEVSFLGRVWEISESVFSRTRCIYKTNNPPTLRGVPE